MSWLFLIIGGLFEASWMTVLKASHNHPKWWPLLLAFGLSLCSFGCVDIATRKLAPSTCYPVWTGIGMIGTTIVGIAFLGEGHNAFRYLCITLILLGVVGLRWSAQG